MLVTHLLQWATMLEQSKHLYGDAYASVYVYMQLLHTLLLTHE